MSRAQCACLRESTLSDMHNPKSSRTQGPASRGARNRSAVAANPIAADHILELQRVLIRCTSHLTTTSLVSLREHPSSSRGTPCVSMNTKASTAQPTQVYAPSDSTNARKTAHRCLDNVTAPRKPLPGPKLTHSITLTQASKKEQEEQPRSEPQGEG